MNGDSATTAEETSSTAESTAVLDAVRAHLPAAATSRASAAWENIERLLIYVGDWLNPILVKETRQALKSLHFTITFVLVLVACWVVTIAGVALVGPSIYYAASGSTLLLWYYGVLAFPLAVVVPYAAFRSLASEREDNTYELLSITTLKPRQIISGKLGSSIVQMAVYFSAITPCLAFTYLLRGIDLPTIAVLLAYTFLGSLGLSMVGILLATLSKMRFAQVFVSVAFVAGLLFMLYAAIAAAVGLSYYSYGFLGGEAFWIVAAALSTFYVTTFALAYCAATAMITFGAENRSTPLRICMLVQQAAWIGWLSFAWMNDDYKFEAIVVAATFGAIYWAVMGALLTSERSGMSQRVKRRLPSSFLGRVFLSWLNPGPATGYMFMVANVTAGIVVFLIGMAATDFLGKSGNWPGEEELICLLAVGWGYLVGYIGIGLLIIRALRHVAVVTMLAGALIHLLVVLAASGIPTVIQLMSADLRGEDYSRLQIPNPIWSLIHLSNGGYMTDGITLMLIVPAAAICVLLMNMPGVIRELRQVRIALPVRVVEDEAELHPAPPEMPTNPWDEPA